jgi:opacity protein-like surface antigen
MNYKKSFLVISSFLLITTQLFAREASSQISGVLYLGASNANCTLWSGRTLGIVVDSDPTLWSDPSTEANAAGGLGFSYRYFATENVALCTGLNLIYKSFTVNYPAYTAIDDLTLDISNTYVIIPAGMRIYFDYFYLGGGLYYGLAGTAQVEVTYTTIYGTTTKKTDEDFDDDFGLYVDLGLDMPLSDIISLDLGMRYEYGLKSVYSNEDAIITDIKMKALLFNVELCFTL